jgi:hypothetical protein
MWQKNKQMYTRLENVEQIQHIKLSQLLGSDNTSFVQADVSHVPVTC